MKIWIALSPLLLIACNEDSASTSTTDPALQDAAKVSPQSVAHAPLPSPTLPAPQTSSAVIFIIDDLAVADANFARDSKTKHYTPNLDALAADSVVLDNFHAVTQICAPSRYTLLTGRYASEATNPAFLSRLAQEGAAVPEFNTQITTSEPTLQKQLQSIKITTGYSGKTHFAGRNVVTTFPTDASIYDPGIAALLAKDNQAWTDGVKATGFDYAASITFANVTELPVKEMRVHNLDWTVDGALNFINKYSKKPFFLVVSLSIPHLPLDPGTSWGADPRFTAAGILNVAPNVQPARSTLTPRVKAAGYPGDENYLWMDDSVGAVIKALKDKGVYDNSAIFLIGDHGMDLKGTIYYGGSHTPALVHYRGIKGRSDQLAAMIDIQPTILEMMGAKPTGQGVSWKSMLLGDTKPIRQELYLELGYARSILTNQYQYTAMRHSDYIRSVAATKGYALTAWVNPDRGVDSLERQALRVYPHYLEKDQLYAYRDDPTMSNNLFGQAAYSTIENALRQSLQREKDKHPGTFRVY